MSTLAQGKLWLRFACLLYIAILLLGRSAVFGQAAELVMNGGFEQGLKPWQDLGLAGDYRASTDVEHHSGSRSLVLNLLPPYQSSPTESFTVGVIQKIQSTRYTFNLTFEFWVKPSHSSVNVEIYGFLVFTIASGSQRANKTLAYFVAYPQGTMPGEIGPHWKSITLDNILPGSSAWNKWNGYTRNIRGDFQSAFGSTNSSDLLTVYVGLAIKTTTTVTNSQIAFWDDISLKAPVAEIPETSGHERLVASALLLTVGALVVTRLHYRRAKVSPRSQPLLAPIAHNTNTRTSLRGFAPLGRLSQRWASSGA